MLKRWMSVITWVASMWILWALFVPEELSPSVIVWVSVLGLLGLTSAVFWQKTRRARSITQMLDDLEAEPKSVHALPYVAPPR
jgi:hypothetical protein